MTEYGAIVTDPWVIVKGAAELPRRGATMRAAAGSCPHARGAIPTLPSVPTRAPPSAGAASSHAERGLPHHLLGVCDAAKLTGAVNIAVFATFSFARDIAPRASAEFKRIGGPHEPDMARCGRQKRQDRGNEVATDGNGWQGGRRKTARL